MKFLEVMTSDQTRESTLINFDHIVRVTAHFIETTRGDNYRSVSTLHSYEEIRAAIDELSFTEKIIRVAPENRVWDE